MSILVKVTDGADTWLLAADAREVRKYKVESRLVALVKQVEMDAEVCCLCSLAETGLWLVVTSKREWAVVDLNFEVMASGSLPNSVSVNKCCYVASVNGSSVFALLAWSCWEFDCAVVSTVNRPVKVKTYRVTANERTHWPYAQIRGLTLLKGASTIDYTGQSMFAALLEYSEGFAVYSFSVSLISGTIEKGPWAIPNIKVCRDFFSVQDQLFLLCEGQILQVNLKTFSLTSVPSPDLLCHMPYSDNCTRILIASSQALYWLIFKDSSPRVMPACEIPGRIHISQMINLNSQGISVFVLLHDPQDSSIVVQINLKSNLIAEVTRFQCRGSGEVQQVCAWRGGIIALVKTPDRSVLRRWFRGHLLEHTGRLTLSGVSSVFRLSKTRFVLTSIAFGWTRLVEVTDAIKLSDSLSLDTKVSSLLVQVTSLGIVQVCSKSLSLCEVWRLDLPEVCYKAVIFSHPSSILTVLSSFDALLLYNNSELQHVLAFQSEITGLTQYKGELVVSFFHDSVVKMFAVDSELVLVKSVQTCGDVLDVVGLKSCLLVACLDRLFVFDGETETEEAKVTDIAALGPNSASGVVGGLPAIIVAGPSLDIQPVHSALKVLACLSPTQVLACDSQTLYLSNLASRQSCEDTLEDEQVSAVFARDGTLLTARKSSILKKDGNHTVTLCLPEAFSVHILTLTTSGAVIAYCQANSQYFLCRFDLETDSISPSALLQVTSHVRRLITDSLRVFLLTNFSVDVYSDGLDQEINRVTSCWEGYELIKGCLKEEEKAALHESGFMRTNTGLVDFAICSIGLGEAESQTCFILVLLTISSLEVVRCSQNQQTLLVKASLNSTVIPKSLSITRGTCHILTQSKKVKSYSLEWTYDDSRLKKATFSDLRSYTLTPVPEPHEESSEYQLMAAYDSTLYLIDLQKLLVIY